MGQLNVMIGAPNSEDRKLFIDQVWLEGKLKLYISKLHKCEWATFNRLYILNMSYIIDQLDNFLFSRIPAQTNIYHSHNNIANKHQNQFSNRKESLVKELGRLSNSLINLSIFEKQIEMNMFLDNAIRFISIILKIKLQTQTQQISFSLQFLGPNNKILSIQTKERRILFSKIMSSRFYNSYIHDFKFAVNYQNGLIKSRCSFYKLGSQEHSSLSQRIHKIVKIVTQSLPFLYQPINYIKQLSSDSSNKHIQNSNRRDHDPRIEKVYKYLKFSNIFLNLNSSSNNQQRDTVNKNTKQYNSITFLKRNSILSFKPNQVNLYSSFDPTQCHQQVDAFELSYLQREEMIDKTAYPNYPKANSNAQGNYILNFIQIQKKPDQCLMKRVNSGGFANIFLTQITFRYVGSFSEQYSKQTRPNINHLPVYKKVVIIKKNESRIKGMKNRILHQINILKYMKHGRPIFLPKYYIDTGNRQSQSESQLIIDNINHPTLTDYFLHNSQSVSYQTKIYFGYMISLGLKYLQEYQITHLDLKPSNIMLYKKMMIRIIDFGESFHPQIKNHKPGFSAPYSAPQNYKGLKKYDSKSDVFSLGIILYEIFLGKYPFYIYSQKKRDQVYRKQSVYDYWYCSTEQNITYGQNTVFPVLQQLIGKCLSPNPSERPELEWIVYILRTCLDYLC